MSDRLTTTDPSAEGWEAVDRMLRAYPTPSHADLCRVATEIGRLRREERDHRAWMTCKEHRDWAICDMVTCPHCNRMEIERLTKERDAADRTATEMLATVRDAEAEVDRLTRGRDRAVASCNANAKKIIDLCDDVAQVEAERDRLREALKRGRVIADRAMLTIEPECGSSQDGDCGPNCELRRELHDWIDSTRALAQEGE